MHGDTRAGRDVEQVRPLEQEIGKGVAHRPPDDGRPDDAGSGNRDQYGSDFRDNGRVAPQVDGRAANIRARRRSIPRSRRYRIAEGTPDAERKYGPS